MPPRLKSQALRITCASRDDAIALVARIGEIERERQRMVADADERVNEIKQALGHALEPLTAELADLQKAVQAYAEAHRDELTQGGKVKTVVFTTGEIGWRQRPPSVAVRAAETVIETLKRMGLSRFVRGKEEVNKEAILAEPDAVRGIAGLSITVGVEDFFIVPAETKLDEPVRAKAA